MYIRYIIFNGNILHRRVYGDTTGYALALFLDGNTAYMN